MVAGSVAGGDVAVAESSIDLDECLLGSVRMIVTDRCSDGCASRLRLSETFEDLFVGVQAKYTEE